MNIGIVGLGLIGGSMAKAIKANTAHTVYGFNSSTNAIYAAQLYGAIDAVLDERTLPLCDCVIVSIPPRATEDYIRENASQLRKDALVVDCCGVKRSITDSMHDLATAQSFTFMGGHPMAGKAASGFKASSAYLFKGATMILTPYPETAISKREQARDLFLSVGFKKVHFSTPEIHDRKIAYTSQLPHLISNAYAKSMTAEGSEDVAAGSYRDMIRVSKFNESMWTELFMENRDYLIPELDNFIAWLEKYSQTLKAADPEAMESLLREGGEG
ncbi:MAG: prephenate dehydrogenase/arogenate dehydrogenase family protein [Coriobacteriales bacterium]|jgi:prephenate dehydrogenase|nr:prephenate dehydrogenase/arogenate dehydrogenase family protein [Coriobacteriales bacterium]